MTSADAYSLALERLHRQGHLLHSQLLQIVAGDESLMREVRDRLIADGLVIDKLGVALVLTEVPTEPSMAGLRIDTTTQHVSADIRQSPLGTAATPAVRDPHSDRNNLGSTSDHDLTTDGLKASWSVSDTTPVPSSSSPLFKVRTAGVSPAGEERVKRNQPAPPSALRYYLWNAGRESGPYPREELEQRLAEGRLQPTDFVRIDSDDEWIPAAKALSQTVSSPDNSTNSPADASPGGSTAPAPATRAEELAAAISLAVANNKRGSRPPSNPQVSTVSRAAPPVGARSQTTSENWLARHFGSGQLQNVALIALLVIGLGMYWYWPPAASTISAEFMACHYELRALHVRNQNPSSSEWKQFVTKYRPRITQLVKTLQPDATGSRPERDLLYAAERGLLTMLDEGLDGPAEKKFMLHMGLASKALKGESIDQNPTASPLSHAGPHGSPATNSGPHGSTMKNPATTSSAVPPGAPTTSTPSPHAAIPPGAPSPAR